MQEHRLEKQKKVHLQHVRPDDLGALVVKETLKRAGNYEGPIDDLIIGVQCQKQNKE